VRNADDFDLFYAGTVRRVTSYLHAVTGSRAEAEDAAQEAFARAWQRWDKVSGYGKPRGLGSHGGLPDQRERVAQGDEPGRRAPKARRPR